MRLEGSAADSINLPNVRTLKHVSSNVHLSIEWPEEEVWFDHGPELSTLSASFRDGSVW